MRMFLLCLGLSLMLVQDASAAIRYRARPFWWSSTAAEGYLNGRANVYSAQGQRAESYAKARIDNSTAVNQEIVNHNFSVQMLIERQKMNKDLQASLRSPVATKEEAKKFAADNLPAPLDNIHFNQVSGKIKWIDLLNTESFDSQRQMMEKLFAIRANKQVETGVGSTNHKWITIMGEEMKDILRSQISLMSPEDYIVAKKFIESLVFESRIVVP